MMVKSYNAVYEMVSIDNVCFLGKYQWCLYSGISEKHWRQKNRTCSTTSFLKVSEKSLLKFFSLLGILCFSSTDTHFVTLKMVNLFQAVTVPPSLPLLTKVVLYSGSSSKIKLALYPAVPP